MFRRARNYQVDVNLARVCHRDSSALRNLITIEKLTFRITRPRPCRRKMSWSKLVLREIRSHHLICPLEPFQTSGSIKAAAEAEVRGNGRLGDVCQRH